jgi:hypothetical protein
MIERRLEAILDEEFKILTSLDFAQIGTLSTEKEALLQDIINSKVDPHTLRHLTEKLKRNNRLITATQAGQTAAQKRIKEFRSLRDCLSFYTGTGHKAQIRTAGPKSLETKA